MSEEKVSTREEKLAPVIARVWQDEAYRKELIADPKGVLQKEFGVELPEGLAIEVLEESPAKLYIVIPPKPTNELGDDQLEEVAGGIYIPTNTTFPEFPHPGPGPFFPFPFPGRRGGW
jgi:hypothetical protein